MCHSRFINCNKGITLVGMLILGGVCPYGGRMGTLYTFLWQQTKEVLGDNI